MKNISPEAEQLIKNMIKRRFKYRFIHEDRIGEFPFIATGKHMDREPICEVCPADSTDCLFQEWEPGKKYYPLQPLEVCNPYVIVLPLSIKTKTL